MSNPLEIVTAECERLLREIYCPNDDDERCATCHRDATDIARAVITALEAAGYKVMWKKPTEGMRATICDFFDWPGDDYHHTLTDQLIEAMHDAVPRYGKPSE